MTHFIVIDRASREVLRVGNCPASDLALQAGSPDEEVAEPFGDAEFLAMRAGAVGNLARSLAWRRRRIAEVASEEGLLFPGLGE